MFRDRWRAIFKNAPVDVMLSSMGKSKDGEEVEGGGRVMGKGEQEFSFQKACLERKEADK